jgi:hypothetical protein
VDEVLIVQDVQVEFHPTYSPQNGGKHTSRISPPLLLCVKLPVGVLISHAEVDSSVELDMFCINNVSHLNQFCVCCSWLQPFLYDIKLSSAVHFCTAVLSSGVLAELLCL